ncbi:MAG: thioredoxin family protein [Bacteroidota bacterium]
MLNYTKLNISRMNRLDRRAKLDDETIQRLIESTEPMTWLVLTEGWCGDAAQVVPYLVKMTDELPNVDIKFILRDQHLDIMDAFLTNGGRSIPKVIFLDKDNKVLGSWGPRPNDLQDLFLSEREVIKTLPKEEQKEANYELKTELQRWYTKDKGIHTQQDVVSELQEILENV